MTASPPTSSFPWRGLLAILAFFLLVGLLSLGQRDLWAPDEPKYALVAKEMAETGQYFVPHVNGRIYPDKPPLLFWSINLAALVTGGFGQPSSVLPVLLAALGTLAVTAFMTFLLSGRRDPLAALLAAGVLAVAFRFVNQGLFGQIDSLLTLCTTLAFLFLLRGTGLVPGEDARRALVVWGWFFMALGTLAKGPVAIILPLGGLLLGARLSGRRTPWRAAFPPLGALVYALTMLAWLAPAITMALLNGQKEWVTNLLFKQTVVRYADSWQHESPFYYFLVVPWYDFFPSVFLLVAGLFGLVRGHGDEASRRARRLLAGAGLFILVFFSIPEGKRGLYLMPVYPLMASLVGLDLAARIREGGRALRAPRVALAVAGALMTALGIWGVFEGPERLGAAHIDVPAAPLVGAIALCGVTMLAAAIRPRWPLMLAPIGLAFALLYGTAVVALFPAIDASRSPGRLIAEIEAQVVPEARGAMVDFRAQFGFHAGQLDEAFGGDEEGVRTIALRLADDEPYWVLFRKIWQDELEAQLPPGFEPLTIIDRHVGDDEYVVFANEAALGGTPPSAGERGRSRAGAPSEAVDELS